MVKVPLKLRAKEAPAEDTAIPSDTETLSMPVAAANAPVATAPAANDHHSQKRKPEAGRYWLQIDRQTKSSYANAEDAEAAGLRIKKNFAMVQVAVYDRQSGSNKILELPV